MSDITTRTIGPEDIVPEVEDYKEADDEPTIDELLEQESRLTLVESIAAAEAEGPVTYAEAEAYDGLSDGEAVEAPIFSASYFKSEPYIMLQANLRTGALDTFVSLDEAREIVAGLSEQLAKADDDLGS